MFIKSLLLSFVLTATSDTTVNEEKPPQQTMVLQAGAVAPWLGMLIRPEMAVSLTEYMAVTERALEMQAEEIRDLKKQLDECRDIKKGKKL